MNASIIIFPGSNCDQDIASSLYLVTKNKPKLVWYTDNIPQNTDLIVIPGGFSFGDYLRSGAIASASKIMRDVIAFSKKGIPIIGICNGFQILTECKLLPGTLMINKNLKFICKEVYLKVFNTESIFLKGINNNIIKLPIAHKMGNFTVSELELKHIVDNNQIAFKYCSQSGTCDEKNNPNGSVFNIAGILSKNKKVLGMMPHPERYTNIQQKDLIMKEIIKFI